MPLVRCATQAFGCPQKRHFPTVNTGQNVLTVDSNHLYWVYIDTACNCGQDAPEHNCSIISGAAKSCHADLRKAL